MPDARRSIATCVRADPLAVVHGFFTRAESSIRSGCSRLAAEGEPSCHSVTPMTPYDTDREMGIKDM